MTSYGGWLPVIIVAGVGFTTVFLIYYIEIIIHRFINKRRGIKNETKA